MADTKITALTAISTNPVNPATFPIPMVDLLDTSMAASGTTKKVTVNQILGAGGTATLASATITGAATVGTTLGVTGVSTFAAGTAALPAITTTGDTNTGIYYPAADTVAVTTGGTERWRVNSAGQVGIGVTPSASWNADFKALQIGSANYFYVAAQNTAASRGSLLWNAIGSGDEAFVYGSTGDPANRYMVGSGLFAWYTAAAGTAGNPISFGNAKMTLNSVGNLTLDAGNLIMGTSGKGIDFSAVTGGTGTATANVLNDYEEGTFTPTVVGTTADGTIGTYYAQSGIYTKVGRVVTVQVYLAWGGGAGATGDLAFAGLPFTTGNIANNYTSGAIGYFGDIALTALNVPSLFASPNTTRFLVNQFPVGGGGLTAVPYDVNGAIMFTATYFTA